MLVKNLLRSRLIGCHPKGKKPSNGIRGWLRQLQPHEQCSNECQWLIKIGYIGNIVKRDRFVLLFPQTIFCCIPFLCHFGPLEPSDEDSEDCKQGWG